MNDLPNIREEGGRIAVEPVCTNKYDLAQLLAAITPENLHAEVVISVHHRQKAFVVVHRHVLSEADDIG